jgi:hypothetical protein
LILLNGRGYWTMYVSETNAETPAKLIAFIIKEVSEKYDVDMEYRCSIHNKTKAKSREKVYSMTRYVSAYIMFEIMQLRNFSKPADCLEYKNEAQFKKAYETCYLRMSQEPTFRKEVNELMEGIIDKSKFFPKYKNFIRQKVYEKRTN